MWGIEGEGGPEIQLPGAFTTSSVKTLVRKFAKLKPSDITCLSEIPVSSSSPQRVQRAELARVPRVSALMQGKFVAFAVQNADIRGGCEEYFNAAFNAVKAQPEKTQHGFWLVRTESLVANLQNTQRVVDEISLSPDATVSLLGFQVTLVCLCVLGSLNRDAALMLDGSHFHRYQRAACRRKILASLA